MKRKLLTILALALAAQASSALAQKGARSLHWRALTVAAQLDADGRLRVRERQTMVFSGDWNGGERSFNIRPGQKLELHTITRIGPDGTARQLRAGDLNGVDEFDWADRTTLRWRSRLPSDPPFANQEIIYELDYTLSKILLPDGEAYRLDHDFAFANRAGVIEAFTLDLDADDVWSSSEPLPFHLERSNLEPGMSVVVTMPLQYQGAGAPSGVKRGLPPMIRLLMALTVVVVVARMLRRFFDAENARGRFAPLTPVEQVNEAWLREHVFSMPPEVVGAAWDNTTSSPEVAAMIARMVLEGKLVSRIASEGRKHVLHLELLVPRADLPPEERRLVDALFSSGKNTTDTGHIEKRYQSSGFDPSALISEGIQKQIRALSPARKSPGRWRDIALNVAVVMLVALAMITAIGFAAGSAAMAAPAAVAILGIAALIFAGVYRSSVTDTRGKARRMVVLLRLATLPVLVIVLGVFEHGALLSVWPVIMSAYVGVATGVALVVMVFGIAFLVLRAARTNESAERLDLRRTLAAGRAFFVRELAKEKPSLADAWYPYLLAFGLGKHIDKWFRAFGGAHDSVASTAASGMAIASAPSGGGWSGGGPQFGGGGGFGGGGAGRTWATAVTTISSGVSAPSSSGSGGGGGGGSSGGGGGGGW